MRKVCIINSGCGGHYDLFRQILKSAENWYEFTIYPDEADVIIHYACGFTEQQMVEIPEDKRTNKTIYFASAIKSIQECGYEELSKAIATMYVQLNNEL